MKNRFLLALVLVVIAGAFHLTDAQANPATMKAIVVHEYGGGRLTGPLQAAEHDDGRPILALDRRLVGRIDLVRVMAAGVNPVDSYARQGMFAKRGLDNRPMIIGSDSG